MKSFMLGALGALFMLVISAIIMPQYSDYTDKARTASSLEQVEPLKALIEKSLLESPEMVSSINIKEYSRKFDFFELLSDGSIVVKHGNAGQVFILIPKVHGSIVTWQCIGGSNDLIPMMCK